MNRLQSDTPYSERHRTISLDLYCFLLLTSTLFVIYSGSITITYIRDGIERTAYKNTSCQLLNYTVTNTLCSSCVLLFCEEVRCFDEQIFVTYRVNNKTGKASILVKSNMEARYPLETQIGNNHTCFYHENNATLIVFDRPNYKALFNLLHMATASLFVFLPFIAFFVVCVYVMIVWKYCRKC